MGAGRMCPRPNHPYADAPRLPEGEELRVEELFAPAKTGPVEIEIGPGRGGFVFERCALRPDVRYLGLEIRLKWATIVNDRLRRQGFGEQAMVVAEDARKALPRLQPAQSVDAFFIHFPDPWWKKRHTKRLVIGGPVLDEIARLLRSDGVLYVQTDVEERAAMYRQLIDSHAAFEPDGDDPGSPEMAENPFDARSPREHRAVQDGLPVHRLRYRRKRPA